MLRTIVTVAPALRAALNPEELFALAVDQHDPGTRQLMGIVAVTSHDRGNSSGTTTTGQPRYQSWAKESSVTISVRSVPRRGKAAPRWRRARQRKGMRRPARTRR